MSGPLSEYVAEINGVETTLMLTDEDAKARGLSKPAAKSQKQAPAPANKARKAPNKKG